MMSPMVVKRLGRALVCPSEPTPSAMLPLSIIDRAPWLRFPVRTLLVFTLPAGGRDPASTIREAISKMLVLYYPLAGRIVECSGPGDLHLDCTGTGTGGVGVCFVEAAADCSLEDADYFEHPFKISPAELLPDFCSGDDPNDMPMLIQAYQAVPSQLYAEKY